MKFRYYFLKEGNRVYDKSELITFLTAQPFVKYNDEGLIKKVYYKNTILNFDAVFVFNNKSIIERIERLNPKFLDLNIYVEFELLTNTSKVLRLVEIIKEVCAKFDFAVYNEYFEDVSRFDKNLLLNVFDIVKKAYKKKYEDQFIDFPKLSKDSFSKIYSFIENKEQIEHENKLSSLNYIFMREKETRNSYVCLNLDLSTGFIIPPACKLVKVTTQDGFYFCSFEDFYKKISKFCKNLDSNLMFNIIVVESKYIRKIKKILSKVKFNRVIVPLFEIPFDNILDL